MGPAPSNPRIDLGKKAWRCLGPAYQIAGRERCLFAKGPWGLVISELSLFSCGYISRRPGDVSQVPVVDICGNGLGPWPGTPSPQPQYRTWNFVDVCVCFSGMRGQNCYKILKDYRSQDSPESQLRAELRRLKQAWQEQVT